ncbi:DUF6719 family protein [Roseomonas sp. AR75]|jgi:hypothetical protein|uniref:DUF6719 family protein n=1 Tax=Roseomonas sp. AR75 TaxID=2562311 RepID=UPI0010C082F6|nr:DUF6719 family protein [Roseomonas sp. AR75]
MIALPPTLAAALLLVQYGGTPRIVTQTPAPGTLRQGERVWVDDGSCPAGQIREIVGGSNRTQSGATIPGQPRQIRCVPRS